MPIHSSAVVHPDAQLDPSCDVGPMCVVGPQARIGARTRLLAQVVVHNRTTLGADNVVHPFACLGGLPQDLKYAGEPSCLRIGDRNVIREAVTLNIGTANGPMQTVVGNDNLLMAGCHIAHDCIVHDHVVVANGVMLAGHVELFDHAILGGLAAVHQFCRVGRLAFVGGGAMVAQDVPPFCIAQGDRATVAGLNVVGLRRAGWERAAIRSLRTALQDIYASHQSRAQAVAQLATQNGDAAVAELCAFFKDAARGVCGARKIANGEGDMPATSLPAAAARSVASPTPPRRVRPPQDRAN